LRGLQVKDYARDGRLRLEQSHADGFDLPAIHGLIAKSSSHDGVGKIYDQAIGAGEDAGLRSEAVAGFDFDFDSMARDSVLGMTKQ